MSDAQTPENTPPPTPSDPAHQPPPPPYQPDRELIGYIEKGQKPEVPAPAPSEKR